MNTLWLQSGGCGGCSMSLLCADTTDFPALLRDAGVHLLWHPSLSLASVRSTSHGVRSLRARQLRTLASGSRARAS